MLMMSNLVNRAPDVNKNKGVAELQMCEKRADSSMKFIVASRGLVFSASESRYETLTSQFHNHGQ